VVVFLGESWTRHAQLDDAYISYRYADNLLSGSGLVYNSGQRVEGITNLLWTLLVATGIALGFKANAAGHALGLISGAAALVTTYLYAAAGLPRGRVWMAALAPWIRLSSVSFALWATSGMETPLFAAAVTAALAAQARGRMGWATAALCVATLTRPDGVIAAVPILGFHLVSRRGEGARAWTWPAVYGLAVALLTAFRLAYYGSPVPNTFHAKVGGIPFEQGLDYLLEFLRDGKPLLLIPAAVAVARDRCWWPGAAVCVSLSLYVVAIGGDVFPHGRFLLPALPCLAVLAVRGAAEAYALDRYAGILISIGIPAAICWQVFATVPPVMLLFCCLLAVAWLAAVRLRRRWIPIAAATGLAGALGAFALADAVSGFGALGASWRAEELREVRTAFGVLERMGFMRAQVLRERPEPIRLVAGGAIGSFGFFSGMPIVDVYGIVDPEIARSEARLSGEATLLPGHQRSNADLIFARKPDYILIPRPGDDVSAGLPANLDLAAHADLATHYEWDEEVWGYRRRGEPRRGP
jgi:hypothetical protein